jgi:mono/diheme cytochrome c family protein
MSGLDLTTLGNSLLGMMFVALAAILTFLMFYVWKFPFDHEKSKSFAPPIAVISHRLLGYLFVLIYIYIMWKMVPRLWSYQIELPARTVVHLVLGILIGALLITKIVIVRFFKHMEARLAPILGSGLFICAILLVGLVLPFSLREAYLESTALGDDSMVESRIERIRKLLPPIGLADEKLLDDLASKKGLIAGRRILTAKCVQCHDLRTVLARPRTPKSWRQTVSRMASRSTILNPITEDDQWFVTAYLVAVSPILQETLKQRRKIEMGVRESQASMESAEIRVETEDSGYDHAGAESLFIQTCSQCHSHTQVEQAPPGTKLEAIALVKRMVVNGLEASDSDLATIIRYLTTTYARQQPGQGQTPPEQGSSEDMIPIDGIELYSQRFCIGCHGPGGDSPSSPFYPVLAGQNKDYLIRQFKDIRSGRRSNGATATMSALVQNVTDQEIAAIADYLSVQK